MGVAMPRPKAEPRREMGFGETECKVFHRHGAAVEGGAARGAGPKIGDGLKVRGPVGDTRGEDRCDFGVLPHIGVKVPEEIEEPGASSEANKERSG